MKVEKSDYEVAMDILSKKVDRGEVYLDSVDPEWYKKVNLPKLNMKDGNSCICGWVFKQTNQDGYSYFVSHSIVDGRGYGFTRWHGPDMPFSIRNSQQWSMLAELWTVKVEKRLAADGLCHE